jgi:Ricin-type beta-trefoil lectin domain-like/RibD C-terminal domain
LAEVALDEALGAAALLLGRRSYEWFAGRWPSRSGELADRLNRMPKYVVSSTLEDPEWNNSTVLRGDVVDEVSRLKRELDGAIVVPASFQLLHTLIEHDLVDELRLKLSRSCSAPAPASSARPATSTLCVCSTCGRWATASRSSPTSSSEITAVPCNARPRRVTNAPMLLSRIPRWTVPAGIALALALAPSVASAQPLQSVAITTSISGGYQVLDVEGASTQLGAKVIQFVGTGGSNQKWTFATRADGQQQLVNNRSGMCLTTNGLAGSQLYQWTCNGGPRQVWKGDLELAFTFRYHRLTNPSTGLVIDIKGDSVAPGAPAIGWYPNNNGGQAFAYIQLY